MGDELDDTVIVPPRLPAAPPEPDLDDTVVSVRPDPRQPGDPAPDAAVPRVRDEAAGTGPGYYAFRVGLGSETIPLDAPAYIGRRPSAPRVVVGGHPRLIRVASPQKEVSATHLELRQRGASVVVTDLRSTNGSTVMIPGSVPRKLRQGESIVVSPGTLVDIGDGNILQVLPMQRRTQPAERQP